MTQDHHMRRYIGQHRYAGIGLDPNYHGSSKIVASNPNDYTLLKEVLLEECDDSLLDERERYYITDRWHKFGIAPEAKKSYAFQFWKDNNIQDGIVLNGHASNCEQLHNPEVHAVAVKAIKATFAANPDIIKERNKKIGLSNKGHKVSVEQIEKQKLTLAKTLENNPALHKKLADNGALCSATKRANAPRYELSDGFIGNRWEIAEYLGIEERFVQWWLQGHTKRLTRFKKNWHWSFKKVEE